jgi:CheY-like chemotaxis protein
MSGSIRILVVDDDFATLDFLRSILELSEEKFEVLGVPSAEEGLLALKRTTFHLLVADIRLPGISGIQLAHKAREIHPGIPVIMITGYDLEDIEDELSLLWVTATFTKPLDAEDFLEAVFRGLDQLPESWPEESDETPLLKGPLVPVQVGRRLDALCSDTGAKQVVLATVTGQMLYNTGGKWTEEDQSLITATAFSMDGSFHLSDRLGRSEPQAIQYLTGEKIDLYCSNVDRNHFLAILFDARVRRGRIGTVWVFTQRAIKEIRKMLAESLLTAETNIPTPTAIEEASASKIEREVTAEETATVVKPTPPAKIEIPTPVKVEPTLVPAAEEARNREVESVSSGDITAMESLLEASANRNHIDLDAYWNEALLRDSYEGLVMPGISLEEAQKMGLIGSDFDHEEE